MAPAPGRPFWRPPGCPPPWPRCFIPSSLSFSPCASPAGHPSAEHTAGPQPSRCVRGSWEGHGTGKAHTSPLEVLREHLVGGCPRQQEAFLALLCGDGTGSLESGIRGPCSSQQEELMADLSSDGQIDRCTEAGRAAGARGRGRGGQGREFCWLRMREREGRKQPHFHRSAVLPACCGCYGAPGAEGTSRLCRDAVGWG